MDLFGQRYFQNYFVFVLFQKSIIGFSCCRFEIGHFEILAEKLKF